MESNSFTANRTDDDSCSSKESTLLPPSQTTENLVQSTIEPLHGVQFVLLAIGLFLGLLLVFMDETIVAVAIPSITNTFHGVEKVAWYTSSYLMTFGGFQSTWGKFFKYFPLRSSFVLALTIFELGSLICATSSGSIPFIVGRAIEGIGAAGITTGAFTVIALTTEPQLRPMLNGLTSGMFGLAAVVSPIIGGSLAEKATWRWCFYINLPVGGLSSALVIIFLTGSSQVKPIQATKVEKIKQMDPIGTLLAMGMIITFILAMENGQTKSWHSGDVLNTFINFLLLLFIFCTWQIFQGDRAMIPFRLLRQRTIWIGAIYQFLLAGSSFVIFYYLPIYFQSVRGSSPIISGVSTLPLFICVCLFSVLAGWITTKTALAGPLMMVGSFLGAIGAILIYTLDQKSATASWIGFQIFNGVADGIAWQAALIIAQAGAQPNDISSVTAIIFFFQNLGGAFALSGAQCGFARVLLSKLRDSALDIDTALVFRTGATRIRDVFSPAEAPVIIAAYMAGLKVTFILAFSMLGVSFFICLFNKHIRLPNNNMEVNSRLEA